MRQPMNAMPDRQKTSRPNLRPGSLLLAGLLVSALATAASLMLPSDAPRARAQSPSHPLEGQGRWITFANGDRVNRILRDGNIAWAATEGGGLVRWDLQTYEYRQYLAPQDGLASNQVNDLALDAEGLLWLATDAGLSRLNPATDRIDTVTPETSPDMPAPMVTALEPAPDGTLWVGFAQSWDPEKINRFTNEPGAFGTGGLARYEPATGNWLSRHQVDFEGERNQERYKTIPSENITDLEYASDGILWIGTRPYYDWDDTACFDNQDCKGFWILRGGGLAAHDGSAWTAFAAVDGTGGCFSNHITGLSSDADGRMWAATNGRGVLLMQHGMRKTACNSGQAYYVRGRNEGGEIVGLQGNLAHTVAVNQDGRVWIGHASDTKTGRGIAILQHNGTFDDSSGGSNSGAGSDDLWTYLQVDGAIGASDALVTALDLSGDIELIGTKDNRNGDGFGLRAYDPVESRWTPMRTADSGLPSNQISDLAVDPADGTLWISTLMRGVARFDGQSWRSWRMFGEGEQAAEIQLDLNQEAVQLPVDIETVEDFDSFFELGDYLRIENDPTYYRVVRYIAPRSGLDGQIRISPKLTQPASAGTKVYTVDRGPASDMATQIEVDAEGRVWVGGGETVWTGDACPQEKAAIGQCWLDGGLGRYVEGEGWKVFNLDNSDLVDNQIWAVELDGDGRIWASMSNEIASGYGIGIYDPTTQSWTLIDRSNLPSGSKFGGNGISDIALDPDTGDMWTVHHSVVEWVQNIGGTWSRVFLGGGVSRWDKDDGGKWSAWSKRSGSPLRAHSSSGTDGEMTAVLVDRSRGRVWAGAWDSDDNFHWINGYGVHAAVNWCPLESCSPPDWQSQVWREDGKVSSLALDGEDRLWVGTTREGAGLVPPVGGIKLYDGQSWHELTPDNVALNSIRVAALESDLPRERMWVGTDQDGITLYDAAALPEPTDEPSPTREPGTATPDTTIEPTPTDSGGTPVPGTTAPTRVATATATRVVDGCPPLRIYLPMSLRSKGVPPDPLHVFPPTPDLHGPCPTASPTATPRPSATTAPTAGSTPTASATNPVETDTPAPTATEGASPTLGPTAAATDTPTGEPSPTATGEQTPTASPTATQTPEPTDSATTPTPDLPPLGDWSVFTAPNAQIPSEDFFDVTATGADDVWFIGDNGTALNWNGVQLTEAAIQSQARLRSIVMLSSSRGYIAGDGGTLLQLRSRRWSRADTGSYTDEWAAVDAVDGPEGPVAWVVGSGRGNRLRLIDSQWTAPGPADRNTGHSYSDLAVVGESLAYTIQDGTGSGRIYSWDGNQWSPEISTGPLLALHVPASDLGMAVGPRGTAWWLAEPGDWERMPSQPATGGQDLRAVSVLTRHRAFVGGDRSSLFHWNGDSWNRLTIGGATRNRAIHAIWMSPDGSHGWAVGEDGLILRYE